MIAVGFSAVVALLGLLLGILVVVRAPRQPAHVSFGIGMVVVAIEVMLAGLGGKEGTSESRLILYARYRLLAATFFSAPWIVFSLSYSRGDHQEVLRRWRPHLLGVALGLPAFALLFWSELATPGIIPATVAPLARLGWAGYTIEVLLLSSAIIVLTNLERTFRHVVGVMRWRTKYVFLAVGVLAGLRIYASSQALLYRSADIILGPTSAAGLLVVCFLIGIALFRTRVFDVDVYPSHALVYGSVTFVLTGAYLVTVGLISHLLGNLGSAARLPLQTLTVTLALAGLAVVLLSEQVRRGIRNLINRHLHRPTFDYRQVWSAFTRRTRSLIDEDAYGRAVTHWLSETFSALSVSLWRFDSAKEELALSGSTVVPTSNPSPVAAPLANSDELIRGVRGLQEPTSIDYLGERWAEGLRRLHPAVFPQAGNRLVVPIRSGDDFLGILLLGDRVGGQAFSAEEIDLLTCAADQIASGLLGLQLSRQRVRSKELEAFQTMSAFFVHDLKNTASTLSLTLRNLQQHFSNPDFREDALRAVGKSVQHLNDLIARLTRLRQEWRVQVSPGSLVTITQAAIVAAGQDPKIPIKAEYSDVPPTLVDATQMEKVIVNLILNSRDAMPEGGPISIRTYALDSWGVVSVQDQGCGMTAEFVRRSLFRPFQTTKRNGLGIGMFHCKTIVDAHGGRMEVETSPGRGTTVQVLLPLAPNP